MLIWQFGNGVEEWLADEGSGLELRRVRKFGSFVSGENVTVNYLVDHRLFRTIRSLRPHSVADGDLLRVRRRHERELWEAENGRVRVRFASRGETKPTKSTSTHLNPTADALLISFQPPLRKAFARNSAIDLRTRQGR